MAEAAEQLAAVAAVTEETVAVIDEVVADKGEIESRLNRLREKRKRSAERRKAPIDGDPFKAEWALRTAVEGLATNRAEVAERIGTAMEHLARVRRGDFPLALHTYWRPIEEAAMGDAPARGPIAPEAAEELATAIFKLWIQLRHWILIERPGIVV